MKSPSFAALVVLSLSGCQTLPVAETPPTPAAASASVSQSRALAGNFEGKWTGVEGTAGNIRITLKQAPASTWMAEAMFTYEGAEIPGKVRSVRAEGTRIQVVFDWEIQGTAGQSTISGELKGDTLQGTYETRGVAGASRGTWSATRS